MGLFDQLKSACAAEWRQYTEHAFVHQLGDGTVALAPCVIGYGEIGRALAARRHNEHPYRDWIESYSGPEYQAVAQGAVERLDQLMARRGGPGRIAGLTETFRRATRLEADFWQM